MARDGKSGWELAQTYQYDLIILDLMLPGLTGGEVLNRLPLLGRVLRRTVWVGAGGYF